MSKLRKWNDAYQNADFPSATPARLLSENSHLLPDGGSALDLACGRAGNAFYLAKLHNRQFEVDAIDFSNNVIDTLTKFVTTHSLTIKPILRDIETNGISDNNKKYDVIVVSYFLNRSLFPEILQSLKPNGLLFYQTWSQRKIDDSGPNNPNFRLKEGELLDLCADLTTLIYREEGDSGDIQKGFRNEAMIIAQRPIS